MTYGSNLSGHSAPPPTMARWLRSGRRRQPRELTPGRPPSRRTALERASCPRRSGTRPVGIPAMGIQSRRRDGRRRGRLRLVDAPVRDRGRVRSSDAPGCRRVAGDSTARRHPVDASKCPSDTARRAHECDRADTSPEAACRAWSATQASRRRGARVCNGICRIAGDDDGESVRRGLCDRVDRHGHHPPADPFTR